MPIQIPGSPFELGEEAMPAIIVLLKWDKTYGG
jgi:hypothetical protein